MGVTKVYRQAGDPVIASFDWQDLADGTGKKTLNLFATGDDAGINYELGADDVYSQSIEVKGSLVSSGDASYVKSLDLDFDLSPFNSPRTIKGTGILNLSWYSDGAGVGILHSYIIVKIRKWDGTTETEIASEQSVTFTQDTTKPTLGCIPITIPETPFKIGETLRVTIEGWVNKATNVTNGYVTIGIDPKNRDGTEINPSSDDPTTTTNTIINMPFEIDNR